jgi:hemoglobin/transferrin/lactoferrin receptor protein
MKQLLLCFFFFTTFSVHAQFVTVLDRESNLPIENVSVYNDTNTLVVSTNKQGKADLSGFKDADILSFNHLSYVEFDILKRELSVLEFVVYLNKRSEMLDEIVLSASKGVEKRSRVAEQLVITSQAEIKKFAPQTSADLLANLPGVRVQKSQFGGGSPVLRGMEANRVLLVIDGVRMNNAIYRTGHLQNAISVSPNTLERTEVIFGPSSVIYGSDALGGVIHFYTKSPQISNKKEVKSGFYSRYSSANNEFTSEGNVTVQNSKWASFTSISHSKFGDLKMGETRNHGYENWGKVFEYSNNTNTIYNNAAVANNNPELQKNTGYNQTDLLQKITLPLSEKTALKFNFQYSKSSNIDRFDALNEYSGDNLKWAEWYYGPQKRLMLSTQLNLNPNKKWLNNGTITAAYQNLKESRIQRRFNSLDRSYRNENVDVFSLNGDFFVPLTKDNNRILSYGAEIAYNKVNSNAYGKTLTVNNGTVTGFDGDFIVQSRYPDGGGTYTSWAAYANYRQNITKKATLNSGLRVVSTYLTSKWIDDTFITLPNFDISLHNAALTATLGYAYKPSEDWQLNAVLSSGFRSPNIDDVGKIREKSGDVTVPNIYLKPEYAYNAETGILKYFNNKKLQLGVTVYYTLLDNYITRDYFEINNSPTIFYDGEEGNIVANVNKNNAYIAGSTVSVSGALTQNWFTTATLTYTKGKAYDTKLPLSSIPPVFGSITAGYEKDAFQAALNFKFNGKKSISDYNLIEGIDNVEQAPYNAITDTYLSNPAWSTLNFNASYKFNKAVTFFVNADNLFDIHYKEFATAISAPGRNIALSVLVNI